MDYYKEIIKFLSAAKKQITGKGTTKEATIFNQERIPEYKDLKTDVSFGIGRATAIPWISFLGKGQTTSNGIYPVYLFYKEKELLILAYGVSEKNPPKASWNLPDSKNIESYFIQNNLGIPKSYGSSFVYKVYKTNQPLNEKEINDDLNDIIQIYNQTLLSKPGKSLSPMRKRKFEQNLFFAAAKESGLSISNNICLRFIASLLTKPFLILTGLSGSGKTKLAQVFSLWVCENKNQYCILPVGADWSNREPLLGFPNALKENEYVKPENGALNLIMEANENQDRPYFLILDEMNMSHVERYFADFLSVMESKGKISLHSGNGAWNDVPAEIGLPKNLFIIGTVNIDETTYMFSPKVLDRANVIEFRVTKDEMNSYLQEAPSIKLENLTGLGASMAESFIDIAKDDGLHPGETESLNEILIKFFTELKKIGAEFGYRSASEIYRFAAVVNKLEPSWAMTDIVDAAIMQKLLPKVHGSKKRLEPVLRRLGELCLNDPATFDEVIKSEDENIYKAKAQYQISLEKIIRMYKNLMHNGFTSYAEA